MAGTPPGFNANTVRAGLRTAMQFGEPGDTALQPIFYTIQSTSSASPTDSEGTPFDSAAVVTAPAPKAVQVDCAVEYRDADGRLDAYGYIAASRIALTFMDVDYAKVRGFDYCVINGNKFNYRHTEPPIGMGPITIYTVVVIAEDES